MDSNGLKLIFALPPATPVAMLPGGIRFDILHGLRMQFPADGETCHVTVYDADTGTVLFQSNVEPGSTLARWPVYYVRYGIIIRDADGQQMIYEMDLHDQTVMIQIPASTIGDTMAWFPYAEAFRQKHGCRMIVSLQPKFIPLFEKQYPDIEFVEYAHAQERLARGDVLACYLLGLWWDSGTPYQPCDHRFVGLHKNAAYILGLDAQQELRPRFDLSAPRKIADPYVCIAVQSTTMAKNWTAENGWLDVITFLKNCGYRVLCIDRDRMCGDGVVNNYIPHGCEDFTGNLPLQERINLLKDADFFIGLASGLSWLAWGCDIPVVMISGFSHPTTEFYTPYRVINYHACNCCWNDDAYDFRQFCWTWCPRLKDTPRQWECMRMISAHQVIETIKRIPAFKERTESNA